jgi:hypothetical protein
MKQSRNPAPDHAGAAADPAQVPACGLQSAGEYVRFCFIIKEVDNLKGKPMTEFDTAAFASDEELEASVRPLVNEILDRFNQESLSPSQAGLVILALIYRLLEVLKDEPEGRRFFILTLINLINNYLADEMETEGPCTALGPEEEVN